MFNKTIITTIVPPDRLLTEIYKDKCDADKRKYARLDALMDNPTFDEIKRLLYKGGNNFILKNEFVSRQDLEWYLEYKEKYNP